MAPHELPLDLSFDDDAFSGHVPLFPLPNLVLLPGGVLPLHVFEHRYRAMVQHAMSGERLIAMALLETDHPAEPDGTPHIQPTICVGRVVFQEPLEDGRSNIILLGLRRARILDEDRSQPFRIARVELLPDRAPPHNVPQLAQRALSLLEDAPRSMVRDADQLRVALDLLRNDPLPLPLGTILDLLADVLTLDIPDRLLLLETPEVPLRLDLLGGIATSRRETAGPWPPRFSLN